MTACRKITKIMTRSMNNVSEAAFSYKITSIDWERAIGYSVNVNFLVEKSSSLYYTVNEKHAPLRQVRVSERYCPRFDANLKSSI